MHIQSFHSSTIHLELQDCLDRHGVGAVSQRVLKTTVFTMVRVTDLILISGAFRGLLSEILGVWIIAYVVLQQPELSLAHGQGMPLAVRSSRGLGCFPYVSKRLVSV